MLIYIIYFIVLSVLAIEYNFNKFQRWPVFVLLIIALGLLAGLRGPNVSSDYSTYKYSFDISDNLYNEIKQGSIFNFFEPGYVLAIAALKNISELNYTIYIMMVFAFVTITLKVIATDKLSINPFLAILFYFSHYFILMEMTQIRIGFASALFFIALTQYLKGNRLGFIMWVLLACCFHYSALLYFIVLLFNYKNLNRPLYLGVLFLSIVLGILKFPLFDFLNTVNPELIAGKLKSYDYVLSRSVDLKINTFNVVYIINVLAIFYLVFIVPRAKLEKDGNLCFFIKCNALSVFFLSVLSGVPIIAFRMSELFGVTSFLMFAGLVNYLPFKKLNVVFLIGVAAIFFYINFFHVGLLKPYDMVNFR